MDLTVFLEIRAEKPGVIRCKSGKRAFVCLMMKSVLSLIPLVTSVDAGHLGTSLSEH